MLPLAGLRVLAIESYGAGPYGTMLMADLGADVIKIENRAQGGDSTRASGPLFDREGVSLFYHTFNRNKRSLSLDLQHPAAKAVLRDLVSRCDAVANNLRGDVPNKLGLDYESLKSANRAIVCTHLSAYGRTGSRASWPGYDFLMQAETGFLYMTGEPEGPPARCGLSIVDMMAGIASSFALLAGVLQARATGVGRDLEVSLFDTALASLWYNATWYLNAGHVQNRLPRSAHPSLGPTQLYTTKDGWIFIMCPIQKFWIVLTKLLERPDLMDHPDFREIEDRRKNRDRLTDVLDGVFGQRTTAEWMTILGGHVPAAPVYDIAAALDNPFVQERGRIVSTDGEHPIRSVASPVSLNDEPLPTRRAPDLGSHTDEVLREIGYDDAKLQALRASGAI